MSHLNRLDGISVNAIETTDSFYWQNFHMIINSEIINQVFLWPMTSLESVVWIAHDWIEQPLKMKSPSSLLCHSAQESYIRDKPTEFWNKK